jgi:hypothetical protein
MGRKTMVRLPTASDIDEAQQNHSVAYSMIGQDEGDEPEWTGASWAAAHAYGLRSILNRTTLVSTVLLLGLMVYYALVFLNWTFTFDTTFQQSNVPFYEPSTLWRSNSDRFGIWWWIAALTLLRLITVFGSVSSIAYAAVTGKTSGLVFMKWWITLYGIFDGVLFIFYLIMFIEWNCATVQFCRSFDSVPGDPPAVAGQANVFYHVFTWTAVGFIGVHILYGIWINAAEKTVEDAKAEAKMSIDEDKPF